MPDDKRARFKQLLESGEIALHPLSFPQRELWEGMAVPAADPANHICSILQVKGSIPVDIGRAMIHSVVDRQDVLRLSFLPGKESGPMQMIKRSAEANFHVRELNDAQREPAAVEELLQEIFSKPFDMVRGPLYRVELVVLGPTEMMLVLAIHHSIADGWSLGVFLQDLCAAYLHRVKGLGPLPPVPMTWEAWAAAERAAWSTAELGRCAQFWKDRLQGAPRLWQSEDASHASSHVLQRWTTHLPVDLARGVRELVKRARTTLFSTLLCAFNIALSRWKGVSDIVVGTPVANRSKAAVRETMGYFSGVVPLRNRVDSGRSFASALSEVHESTMDCFANAMPFAELVKALGDLPSPGHHPIYQVRFALQNHPVPDMVMPGLSIKLKMCSTGTSRFNLGCEITEEGEKLEVVWLWRPDIISREEVETLSTYFTTVISSACRAPESVITALATPTD